MMNSTEMLNLVAQIRRSATDLKAEQYRNGTYSRSGGTTAYYDLNKYPNVLGAFAIDMVTKEAVEAALAQLPISQTIIVKI